MLKLTYARENDKFKTVTVIGDSHGIRDLYWQLTRNYQSTDGTKIGSIHVTNLDGIDCTESVLSRPHAYSTYLSLNIDE
jgi:hypothetical protein